ncbi:MAG: DUF4982 domain-containing protein [Clostridia bacterium]|nr:DUF4982 domain-containing protein [Clostridia bacterium]
MKIRFNDGWQFLDNGEWTDVTLPHTAKVEEYDVSMHYQGKDRYRKHFSVSGEDLLKRTVFEFEAIMQYAEITVNGVLVCRHFGGYLPAYADVTGILREGDNIIEVLTDNTDAPDIPPGKPLANLDFCYFGGIYRNVWLHKTDRLHITLPVMKAKCAGGGIFVSYPKVSSSEAKVRVRVNAENADSVKRDASVSVSLTLDGRDVACAEKSCIIAPFEDGDFSFDLTVTDPQLWSPDSPTLYDLDVRLSSGGKVIEEKRERIGIRTVRVEDGVFYLNEKPVKIYGTNRHQSFPYVGNAASDEAQYRDMCLIKEMGVNFVRLCHYPQSESTLAACDELGLMVTEPVPGWQWFNDTEQFRRLCIENAQDMVRRDRNRACVVFWEATLNEAHNTPDSFAKTVVDAIREEFPDGNCLISGDTLNKDARYIGLDICHPGKKLENDPNGYKLAYNGNAFYREYGDFNFGGNYSSSRRGREDGDMQMLLASWNQWHTYNERFGEPEVIGLAAWVGIDYNRGYWPEFPLCRCGALDSLRQKKFQFYMMRSQGAKEPTVFIANNWEKPENCEKIVVFSNCEEVALCVNGKMHERIKPSVGAHAPYKIRGLYADPYYWVNGSEIRDVIIETDGGANNSLADRLDAEKLYREDLMWDGTSTDSALHPPFIFRGVTFERGFAEAIGYIDGKEVCRHKVSSYGEAAAIVINADDKYALLKPDGNDFVFVNAEITDSEGNRVYNCKDEVTFEVVGGRIIGPSTVNAIAGVATVMLSANSANPKVVAKMGKISASSQIKTAAE